jgi:2'-hydroxyisoflavone reductase
MKLLVLGGTVFLGRHFVDAALAAGHEVTLFNRGNHRDVFPEVETRVGDRDGGLAALAGGSWDAAVDMCGFAPAVVAASARMLAERVDRYAFVSSISVYADTSVIGIDESGRVRDTDDYGGNKAACEVEVERALPGRALVIRPGLIVGPHDPTDRFTYWPRRVARGGDVLAPGAPSNLVQWIDVRDLAAWILRMVERSATGVFNACGPSPEPLAMGAFLAACRDATGSDARFVWIDEDALLTHGVEPYTEMPLWVPRESAGFSAIDRSRALAAGLAFRTITGTIGDTRAWDRARGDPALSAGMAGEREREILAAYRA